MITLEQQVETRLALYRSQGRYRQRCVRFSAMDLKGTVLDFSSNDYLGLARHPALVSAATVALQQYGVGSQASPWVSGYTKAHERCEQAFAEWLGYESAILFNSGYQANMGVVQALLQEGDYCFQDKRNHASLVDAGRLTPATFKRYRHLDVMHLENLLQTVPIQQPKLIASDAVFSMSGAQAPVAALAQLAARYQAWLMVDEAHGLGVLGGGGQGLVSAEGLSASAVPILVCPLGKALGGAGAIVASSRVVGECLLQFSRTYGYSTAIPPLMASAMAAALAVIQQEPERRERLSALIAYYRAGARQRSLPLSESFTPIQTLVVHDEDVAMAWSQALKVQGIIVAAIRPPSVPRGQSLLRIVLTAHHTFPDVDRLLDALSSLCLRGWQSICT